MKPKDFNIQVDETKLFQIKEEKIKYMRERTTAFRNIKLATKTKTVVPVLTYKCFDDYDELLQGRCN